MDATITPTSPLLPLTRRNLRAFTKMTSSGRSSPKGSSTTSGATSRLPFEIRRDLRHFNIFVEEVDLPQADPSIRDLEKRCVQSSRGSPGLCETEHDEIRSLVREYVNFSEASMSKALVDRMFTLPEALKHLGLFKVSRGTSFLTGRIPNPDTSNDLNWQTLLDQLKTPPNPRPNYIFGLQKPGPFDPHQSLIEELQNDIAGADEIYFPFLIVQGKSATLGDNSFVAENRASRGGSAIVNTMRKLYGKIALDGNPEALGYTDLAARTACFSCVFVGRIFGLWVHWFRFVDGVIQWHSTVVLETRLLRYDDYIELHRAIHNIFEWGCVERVQQIQEVLQTISEQRRAAELKRKAPSSSP